MTPTPNQLARLRAYAKTNGADWKNKLFLDWASGHDAQLLQGHLLRQLRNNFGPAWLEHFEFTEPSIEEVFLPLREALMPKGKENLTMLRLNNGCAVQGDLVQRAIGEIIQYHTIMAHLGEPESACMQLTKILLNDSAYRG